VSRDDWKLIQTVVAAHEAADHGGLRCTCPNMARALRAAEAFERQFGSRTKPGILPDKYDDRTGRWTTKTWMDAESTLVNADDFKRLPKDVQQKKLSWLNTELEKGAEVLASQMSNVPTRRAPRARKDETVKDILAGARKTAVGTFTFDAQSLRDELGKDEVTTEEVEAYAVRKLEEDARAQDAEMGL
jgi:hypothetical protein